MGKNQQAVRRLNDTQYVSGVTVDMHELHTSIRRVCAGVSITLFAMTRQVRIPQHDARQLLHRCARNLLPRDPVQLPFDLLPQPTLPQKSQLGSHTQFPVLAWKKSLVIAPHVLILGLHACTPAGAER